MSIFTITNLCMLAAWWLACPQRSRSQRLVCTLVGFLSQIVATTQLLGLAQALTPALLFSVNAGVALAAFALSKCRRATISLPSPLQTKWQSDITVLNVTLGLLLALILAVVTVKNALFGPATTDDRWYHIPMAFVMLQNEGFAPSGSIILDAYPKNFEMWLHWLAAGMRSGDWLDAGQYPHLLLFIASVFGISRSLGSSPGASLAGALLSCFAPVIFSQLGTSGNDIAHAGLLLAAVYAWILWREEKQPAMFLTFCAATGLVCGTKFSGPIFAGLLSLPLALDQGITTNLRVKSKLLAAFATIVLCLGGYTYLRNLTLHGNFFYPYNISLGPIVLPGPWDDQSHPWALEVTAGMTPFTRIVKSWLAVGETGYGAALGGFGFTWLLMIACLFTSAAAAGRHRDRERLLVYAVFLVVFIATPLNFSVRFALPLLGLGGIALAHSLDCACSRPLARASLLALGATVALFSVSQGTRSWAYQVQKIGHDLDSSCAAAEEPGELANAFSWVRSHAPLSGKVISLANDDVYSMYCLWNSNLTYDVRFATPDSAYELEQVARQEKEALLFIPKSSRTYGLYRGKSRIFKVRFEDRSAVVVQFQRAGSGSSVFTSQPGFEEGEPGGV